VIKKVKQYNLHDNYIEGELGGLYKREKLESNKDQFNLSNNNLNLSDLNTEKFKKILNNNKDNKSK